VVAGGFIVVVGGDPPEIPKLLSRLETSKSPMLLRVSKSVMKFLPIAVLGRTADLPVKTISVTES
jgi:hypothetical protein